MLAVGQRYRHYRNQKEYIILAIGRDNETLQEVVVYQGQYDDPEFGPKPVWVRYLSNFLDTVQVDGVVVPRFEQL